MPCNGANGFVEPHLCVSGHAHDWPAQILISHASLLTPNCMLRQGSGKRGRPPPPQLPKRRRRFQRTPLCPAPDRSTGEMGQVANVARCAKHLIDSVRGAYRSPKHYPSLGRRSCSFSGPRRKPIHAARFSGSKANFVFRTRFRLLRPSDSMVSDPPATAAQTLPPFPKAFPFQYSVMCLG